MGYGYDWSWIWCRGMVIGVVMVRVMAIGFATWLRNMAMVVV